MVVASSGWMQNAVFPSNQSDCNVNSTSGTGINSGTGTNKMNAKGILICRDNSHVFQERTLNLDQPVKIGRSVARTRAAADNAIFDCKVLSRNHALLWYNAGKFYLQDTRSSNGTFVNNQRLSTTGSESAAKEVCSGDIVQFGVDVVESTKKVTHGCIIATLKLYLPDGKEAKASRSMYMTSAASDVTLEDLYKLNQYVQEASRREKVLHSKLNYLQKLVENTKKATSHSWKALIDEDRLLSRVKTVESQLVVYSKNYSEDKIRNEIMKLEEEKSEYQTAAKEALKKVHQEKLEVTQKLINLESRLNETEEECQSLHEVSKHGQVELQELAAKYAIAQKNLSQLELKLADKEQSTMEVTQWAIQEKEDLMKKIKQQLKVGQALQRKLIDNRHDSVKIHKKMTGLKNYMQTLQDMNTKLSSEEFKDGVNPIEVINAILDTLNEMIAETENMDDLDNLFGEEDNQTKSSDVDSNQKLISNSEGSFDKNELNEPTGCNNFSEYIVPPVNSRRTLVNGNPCLNEVNCQQDNDTNSDVSDDTCSVTSDDTRSLVGSEESGEKSVIEMKSTAEKTTPVKTRLEAASKLEVKFADDVNGEQLETHYHSDDVDEDDSFNSAGSVHESQSPPLTVEGCDNGDDGEKVKELEVDDKQSVEEDKEEAGEYIKTLKPSGKNACECSQQSHTREYIIQLFMSSLESLGSDDDIEAQQNVNREVNELKDWFLREPNEVVIDHLKKAYYRAKNEKSIMQEVHEELVMVKEQYNKCNEEKIEVTRQYTTLKADCGDLLNIGYSSHIKYFAPVFIIFLWMLVEELF